MISMVKSYRRAIIPVSSPPTPGGGASNPESPSIAGASRGFPGEINLSVGPLLDAIDKSLEKMTTIFGTLMVLAVKNDEANLRKVRDAWSQLAEIYDASRVSTLRGLLETEKGTGIHGPGGLLHDPSAAIALIWVRRTLSFVVRCLEGVLDESKTTSEVTAYAYKTELEPFHGWLLAGTFNVALSVIPSREEVYERLGPHLPEGNRTKLLHMEVSECLELLRSVIHSMTQLFIELDLEDTRKV